MQWGILSFSTSTLLLVLGFLLAVAVGLFILVPVFMKRQEKRLRDAKDQFVGLASHYLLTPITIIQTAVSRLQESDSTLNTDQRRILYDAIAMGQQRLWIIAEQLVLINEVEQNNLRLKIAVSDLADVVTNAVAGVDVFARKKRIKITIIDLTQDIKQARIDARRLRQALIAILDNAIKFSVEDTEIKVRISYQNNIFLIEVEDDGIGMPDEVIRHLGEKFYRGSGIYNFDYEGLGLGLYIAFSIIRFHGGDIAFTSRQKRGTLVTVQLPNL